MVIFDMAPTGAEVVEKIKQDGGDGLFIQTDVSNFDEVQAAGVEVMYPDKTPFQDTVQSLYEEYRGTDLYDLIERIKEMGREE